MQFKYRQGYNTQNVLLNCLKYCKSSIDNKGLAGAVFMDVSMAFDCVNRPVDTGGHCPPNNSLKVHTGCQFYQRVSPP